MISSLAFPSQGCYTVILNTFETYVYLAGAFAIGVLAIEVSGALRGSPKVCTLSLLPRAMVAAYCQCLLLESFLWPEATDLCLSWNNEHRDPERHPTSPQLCSPSAGSMSSWKAGGFSMRSCLCKCPGVFFLPWQWSTLKYQGPRPQPSSCQLLSYHSAFPSHWPLPSSGMHSGAMKPGSLMFSLHLLLFGELPLRKPWLPGALVCPCSVSPCALSLRITVPCKSQRKCRNHSFTNSKCIY